MLGNIDYFHVNKIIAFQPGETMTAVKVTTQRNTLLEEDEYLKAILKCPGCDRLGAVDTAFVTIVDCTGEYFA